MRKPSRAVELEDIISSKIIGDEREIIGTVVNIHLALEAILIEALELLQSGKKALQSSFPAKTEWLAAQNVIGVDDKKAFDRFNDFRNDLAHIFAHRLTLADLLALARELEALGIEFSDSLGHYSEEEASNYFDGTIGVLAEIGWCVLFHAAWLLLSAGGRDIFATRSHEAN